MLPSVELGRLMFRVFVPAVVPKLQTAGYDVT
jgi:hypothetical protein